MEIKEDNKNIPCINNEKDEIDLYELYLILKKRKFLIFVVFILFFISSVLYAFLATPIYRTQTTIFPISSDKNLSTIGLMNLPIPIQTKSVSVLEAVLKSRTLRERVVKRLNLLSILFKDKWDEKNKRWILKENEKPPTIFDGANALKNLINVSTDKKTGVITISVDYPENREIAYKIAKAILVETQNILNEKSFSMSKHYREYLEKQILIVKAKLDKLEDIYMKFLRGEIKEVPFIVFDKDEKYISNTNKKLTENDINKMKSKISNMELKLTNLNRTFINPQSYKFNLEKINIQLNLLKNLFVGLLREYEITKFKEKKEEIQFQIIDEPYIPKKPYKPKKKLIVAIGSTLGLFSGIFLAFFLEWIENIKRRGGSKVEEQIN